MAKANDERKNAPADVSSLINAAMTGSSSESNRQAKFTSYMFDSEVTYSKNECEALLKLTGTAKRVRYESILSDLSAEYAKALASLETLKDKEDKTAADAILAEALTRQLNAANVLYTRAVTATFYLRHVGAFNVSTKANGALEFWSMAFDEKGKPVIDPKDGKQAVQKTIMSSNALVREGTKVFRAANPSERASKNGNGNGNDAAKNPATKVGIAPVTATVHDRLAKARNEAIAENKPFGFGEFSDGEEAALNALLKEMIATQFADKAGRIDTEALLAWVEETFPKPKAEKANGNGSEAKVA